MKSASFLRRRYVGGAFAVFSGVTSPYGVAAETLFDPARLSGRVCIVEQARCMPTLFAALALVREGETISMKPGDYPRDGGVVRVNNVTIRATPNPHNSEHGQARLIARGRVFEQKALLVIKSDNVVIDGLGFHNALAPHRNGAGIRHEGGRLTIKNSVFKNNEMGLLSSNNRAAEITILDSEFSMSARPQDERIPINGYPAHNIYIGMAGKLLMRGVWSHSVDVGHTLKSRAAVNDIEGNYFSTRHGTGSYEAEFPNGGQVRFVGNIVEQGANSANPIMLSYGAEYASHVTAGEQQISVFANTFINHYALLGEMIKTFPARGRAPQLDTRGNIFVGPGKPNAAGNFSLWARALRDFAQCDFRPREMSMRESEIPAAQFEYVHPARHHARNDRDAGAISPNNASFISCP